MCEQARFTLCCLQVVLWELVTNGEKLDNRNRRRLRHAPLVLVLVLSQQPDAPHPRDPVSKHCVLAQPCMLTQLLPGQRWHWCPADVCLPEISYSSSRAVQQYSITLRQESAAFMWSF